MEESELDEWFTQERERLEERFYAQALKDSVAAKERFDRDYKALITTFQHKQAQIYDAQMRSEHIHAPIARVRERVRRFLHPIKKIPRRIKRRITTWFFERKMRRILKDKSDLYH
jgi:ppGpp synthetase/RelA/SpoT-type nucleotidyltranferase